MPSLPSNTVKLFVLGQARIETRVATIEPDAEVAFATALFLLLERKNPASRRTLEQLIWPGVPGPTASHRMRQTILKLRQLGLPIETVGEPASA